jgi:hypothetical protein
MARRNARPMPNAANECNRPAKEKRALEQTNVEGEKAEPIQIGANIRPISIFRPQESMARTIGAVKHFYLWRFAAKRRDARETN